MKINQKPIVSPADIINAMEFRLQKQKPQETYIQQTCKVIFDRIKLEMRNKFEMDFMQIDNGGKQTQGGKFRKKAEGTIKGASDVQLWFHCKKTGLSKMVLCEFKRIGTPSQIDIKQEQIDFQERWKQFYNCDGFVTNNPLYFEWRIQEILEKYKILG
jgi:hypothetical protein